ncbi:putative iron-regulated membrane protein [Bradyrhizobium sp. GM22.5]
MRESWRAIKAALLHVHSIAGLVLALLLAVIALTGAIMSFEDEIVDHLNAGIMQVAPRQGTGADAGRTGCAPDCGAGRRQNLRRDAGE